jgi:hypothetical protein
LLFSLVANSITEAILLFSLVTNSITETSLLFFNQNKHIIHYFKYGSLSETCF